MGFFVFWIFVVFLGFFNFLGFFGFWGFCGFFGFWGFGVRFASLWFRSVGFGCVVLASLGFSRKIQRAIDYF